MECCATFGRMKRWISSVVIAFVALLVCSVYRIQSIISTLNKWDNFHSSTSHSRADQQPHGYTSSTKTRKSDLTIGSDDHMLLHPIIVQTMQSHFTRISLNSTMESRRERLHMLEILINHYSKTSNRIDSDVVELRHCRLDIVDYSKFSIWASLILKNAWENIAKKLKTNAVELKGLSRKDDWDDSMYLEFTLGLLEIFATHNSGGGNTTICDFEKYSLNIQRAELLSAGSTLRSVPISSDGLPRLVFVIIAFQDTDHLEALIEACIMPHHLILVHLERRSPPSFIDSVKKIANKYSNVAVVQFGSIIYQTDSVSTVNYQIMYWLTEELKISYDYLLTLGNAAYPLYGAQELANYFQKTERNIWLGKLRKRYEGESSWAYLERKRLIFTAGEQKYTQRTKIWKQNGFDSPIPDYIKTNMTEKTNSGNQAVFSYKVVKQLIDSPQVKELFSMAKYGCCCCLEERTWIAAARIIGHGREAMEIGSMFQVWAGEPDCGGSMKNAILRSNSSFCYKSIDDTKGNLFERQGDSYFRGDTLLEELRLTKERGFLFARKFKSGDHSSLELVEMIKKTIHNN